MSEDAKPAPDAAAWAHVRMRYEQTLEHVTQIAKSIGMSATTLSRRARFEGWTMRGAGKPRRSTESTRDMIKRLKEILQKRLANLEREIDAIGEDISALANERDIRATNTLVRTLEKVLQLEQKDRRQRRGNDTRKLNAAEREELARRIANLLPEENPSSSAGADEAMDGA
jgi:septal ring factor EnvC (AmiA/AmiB activator)